MEPLSVEGLQQIVQRVHIERAEGVAIVSGDEHDRRHPLRADSFQYRETVHLRHLDVQEQELGILPLNRRNRLFTVRALPISSMSGSSRRSVRIRSRASGSSSTMRVRIQRCII